MNDVEKRYAELRASMGEIRAPEIRLGVLNFRDPKTLPATGRGRGAPGLPREGSSRRKAAR